MFSGEGDLAELCERFNSLFIGIGSAIPDQLSPGPGRWCFNSLFIGIGSAMVKYVSSNSREAIRFQFPFHRDRLCNSENIFMRPYSARFNSLFIGIGSAIHHRGMR